jgi:hypothetical protein
MKVVENFSGHSAAIEGNLWSEEGFHPATLEKFCQRKLFRVSQK